MVASIGFAGFAITLFALYLFLRDRDDLNTKAAGTVRRNGGTGGLGTANFLKNFIRTFASRRRRRRMVSDFLVRNQNLWAVRVVSQSFISITVLGDAFNAA